MAKDSGVEGGQGNGYFGLDPENPYPSFFPGEPISSAMNQAHNKAVRQFANPDFGKFKFDSFGAFSPMGDPFKKSKDRD